MVYLLHFNESLYHAKHYIGFTEKDVEGRLTYHLNGRGSPLLRAVAEKHIMVTVARVWDQGDRKFERYLKDQHNAPRFCPICSPGTTLPRHN